ncbi:MAG: Arabinose 5-phosphate isomerase KdsD [Gammaproteobacteria bacterium]|nr:MAG: Arabinose 5-phosphate isomerase KdsD [Gammaproteobacteria bacterium]
MSGMGKSGLIGRKIAATLSSTGTPAYFLHPGEAYHGDLGMVAPGDVFIAISNSGETEEVSKLLPFLRDNANPVIAITGNPQSTLAKSSRFHLNVAVAEEACPLDLAPTSSTTATLAMGDAIAAALTELRGFKAHNFARFHPGGSLGKRLLSRVEDEMVSDNLPILRPEAAIADVISTISAAGLGVVVVENEVGFGLITDGDLRRGIEKHGEKVFYQSARDIMNSAPLSVSIGTRVEDALALMEKKYITRLLVMKDGDLVGIIKK